MLLNFIYNDIYWFKYIVIYSRCSAYNMYVERVCKEFFNSIMCCPLQSIELIVLIKLLKKNKYLTHSNLDTGISFIQFYDSNLSVSFKSTSAKYSFLTRINIVRRKIVCLCPRYWEQRPSTTDFFFVFAHIQPWRCSQTYINSSEENNKKTKFTRQKKNMRFANFGLYFYLMYFFFYS